MVPTPAASTFFTPPALPSNYALRHMNVTQAHQISARTKSVLSILHPKPDSESRKKAASASGDPDGDKDQPSKNGAPKDQVTIVALTAPNSRAAGKLISVVEIVKRELQSRAKVSDGGAGGKSRGKGWWQYTQLKSVVREVPCEVKRKGVKDDDEGKSGKDGVAEQDDEEEDAFDPAPAAKTIAKRKQDGEDVAEEAEPERAESTTKKRAMPILTIYLSTAPVKELRMAFGEQT